MAPSQNEPIEDKGTVILVDPKAKGDVLAFQKRFVAEFRDRDPNPLSRSSHFNWALAFRTIRRIGWYGTIVDTDVSPDKSVIVTIEITPWLVAARGSAETSDRIRERYLVVGGGISLIGTNAHDTTGHIHVFPMRTDPLE